MSPADYYRPASVLPALAEYVEKNILPLYEAHDAAHGPEHVQTVLRNSFDLLAEWTEKTRFDEPDKISGRQKEELSRDGFDLPDTDISGAGPGIRESLDPNLVYTIACYHDVGIRFGRETHEITGAKWLWEDAALEQFFSAGERRLMKEAIEDHRASRSERPRSLYGCLISEADRDVDPERIVRRSMEYGRAHYPELDDEGLVERATSHIAEKYGENGYLHLWMPCRRNEEGLEVLRGWLQDGSLAGRCRKYL